MKFTSRPVAFFKDQKAILLSLLIALITFPTFHMLYASGIDESLWWAFNYFADGHFDKAHQVIFPHGPLAFLMYPSPMGNNVIVAALVYVVCSFLLCHCIFTLQEKDGGRNAGAITFGLMVLLSLCDIQLLLLCLSLGSLFLFRTTARRLHLYLAVFFMVFNLYIKAWGGALGAMVLVSEILMRIRRKEFRPVIDLVAGYIIFFCVFWFVMFHTLSGMPGFIRGQFELITSNSEAASLHYDVHWIPIACSIACLVAVPFFSSNRDTRYLFLLLLLPFFGVWKHAMARAEEGHIGTFLNFLLCFTVLLWLFCNEKKIIVIVLCLISITAFALDLRLTNPDWRGKELTFFRFGALYDLVTDYDHYADERNKMSEYYVRNIHLPDTVLKLIGKKTVDVYPWNHAIIAANKLNWQPRPVIQSYAAYTHWLDKTDATHITSKNSSQFVVWEFTDMEVNERLFEGIDQRYILNDEPIRLLAFFENYSLRWKDGKYMLYEKRTTPLKPGHFIHPEIKATEGKWVDVPSTPVGTLLRAKINIERSVRGMLKSALYKSEPIYIYYQLENGMVYSHRLVRANAVDGVWVNPLVLRPENNSPESRVKRIRLGFPDRSVMHPGYGVTFEDINFGEADLLSDFFGKTGVVKEPLFFSVNSADGSKQAQQFVENIHVEKSDSVALTLPNCYQLRPGQYSGNFEVLVDTTKIVNRNGSIRFRFEGFVRGPLSANVSLVMTNEGTHGVISNMKRVNEDMLVIPDYWTYVWLTGTISCRDIKLGKPLNFYLWHSGDKDLLLFDDMAVTIEEIE